MIAPSAPMSPDALQGIVPALITPLDPDGHVDEESVASLVEFQIDAGVNGLLILGSTGEGPLLSVENKLRLVRTTVAAARGRVPVMVGIAHSSPAESAAFGNLAHQAGANALVTTPPFYFLSSQPELIGYYRYLHPRLDLPLITYDVPSAVKTKIAASTVRALAEDGLIIGIKDSSGDLAGFRDMLIATQHLPHFHALTGSEHYVDAAMLVGGHGGVLGLASVIPEVYVDICSAVRSGDWPRANQLQQRAIAALQMIYVNSSGGSLTAGAIGSFKLALCDMGVIRHPTVSNPLLTLNDEDRARVRAIMSGVGIQAHATHT
ncbi:MAG TPA: dihydrodipicolinate synthase family protein [Chloroflexota bacterium]|jgi:4-hydroxy-tetrahydrodipicolinate synthase